jgi:membrane protease YdiL (CAAX protease family)
VESVRWRRVLAFIGITFAIDWGMIGALQIAGMPFRGAVAGIASILYMLVPALVVLVLARIWRVSVTQYGVEVPRRWELLLAPLVPMVIAVLGLVAAVLMGYGEFDASGMPMIERLREMGQPDMADRAADELGKLPMNPLLLALLTAPLAGFTINGLAAFGEELGWRGLLQQELAPLGFARASVLIGAIWGVWHAPLILLGHNFPEHPRQGVFVMIAACIVLGVIISWIALRAQTVIAAAVAHGTLNALAGLSSMAISGGDQIEILVLGYAGIAAMIPFTIAALVWRPKLSHYEVAS